MTEWDALMARLDAAVHAENADDVRHINELLMAALDRLEVDAIDHPPFPDLAERALKTLQSGRYFNDTALLADRLVRAGLNAAFVGRRLSQALIELGHLEVARALLDELIGTLPDGDPEWREALGLLGRIDKQIYAGFAGEPRPAAIDAALSRAIRSYFRGFDLKDVGATNWHGINVVALMLRGHHDGTLTTGVQEPVAFARLIIRELAARIAAGDGDPWMPAVLGEAHIAIADFEGAAHWYQQFAEAPGTERFQLGSALRQLKEVWRLTAQSAPGGALVAMLQARLLTLDRGAIELSAAERAGIAVLADGVANEAKLGKDGPIRLAWLKAGITAASAVARIRDRHSGETLGSGFLVEGGALHPSFAGRDLLVTANHVVGDGRTASALNAEFAEALFEEADGTSAIPCGAVVWQSPEHELDVTLIELLMKGGNVKPLGIAPLDYLSDTFERLPAARSRAIIIGYPGGSALAISLADSAIVDIGAKAGCRADARFLHYRTPTAPGSSGGPVFAADGWSVIAVHRGGPDGAGGIRKLAGKPGMHLANEGTLISAIVSALAADLAVPAGGAIAPDDVIPEPLRDQLMRLDMTDQELRHHFWVHAGQSEAFKPEVKAGPLPGEAEVAAADGEVKAERMPMALVEGLNFIAHWRREQFYHGKISGGWSGLKLVTEGDSWFQYPFVLDDVVDQLQNDYAICDLAGAGHTLQLISAGEELYERVAREKPDGVMLSGGGNDLLGEQSLTLHLKDFVPGLEPEAYLRDSLGRHLDLGMDFYHSMIERLLKVDPALKILCHGYDWVIPDETKGGWLGQPMKRKGIVDPELQRKIVRVLIDRFNERIAHLETDFKGHVFYVDCRGAVGEGDHWYDELHPTDAGFARVAERFRKRIREVFPVS